jgi:hypothetical protein
LRNPTQPEPARAGIDPNQPASPDDEQEQAGLQALEAKLLSSGNIRDAVALYNARKSGRRRDTIYLAPSGKSPAYLQHRKNCKSPRRETGRGFFHSSFLNRTAAAGATSSHASASRQASQRAAVRALYCRHARTCRRAAWTRSTSHAASFTEIGFAPEMIAAE